MTAQEISDRPLGCQHGRPYGEIYLQFFALGATLFITLPQICLSSAEPI